MNLVNTTLSQKYGDPYVIKCEHLWVCTKIKSLYIPYPWSRVEDLWFLICEQIVSQILGTVEFQELKKQTFQHLIYYIWSAEMSVVFMSESTKNQYIPSCSYMINPHNFVPIVHLMFSRSERGRSEKWKNIWGAFRYPQLGPKSL